MGFDYHHRPIERGESALAIAKIDQSRWQGFIDSLLTLYVNLVTLAMCDRATSCGDFVTRSRGAEMALPAFSTTCFSFLLNLDARRPAMMRNRLPIDARTVVALVGAALCSVAVAQTKWDLPTAYPPN